MNQPRPTPRVPTPLLPTRWLATCRRDHPLLSRDLPRVEADEPGHKTVFRVTVHEIVGGRPRLCRRFVCEAQRALGAICYALDTWPMPRELQHETRHVFGRHAYAEAHFGPIRVRAISDRRWRDAGGETLPLVHETEEAAA